MSIIPFFKKIEIMPTCTALTGISKGCDNNIGGIKELWLIDQEDIDTVTEANGIVTAVTTVAAATVTGFEFRRNTSNFTEESAIDLINGSTFWTHVINLMLHRREATKSEEIRILAEGQRDLAGFVKDANDVVWYFEYLQLTATGEGSGTAKADGSKYSLAFTAESTHPIWQTDQTVLDSVK